MIVLDVIAVLFLGAAFIAASIAPYIVIRALWERRRQRAVPPYRGREVAAPVPARADDVQKREREKLADWYSTEQLTPTELELLAEFVMWQGRTLPETAEAATAMLWADFEARAWTPLEGVAAVPDLPAGYFDGRVSAVKPEDTTGWVEWKRGMDANSIWIRRTER